jgi:hypothetical protein
VTIGTERNRERSGKRKVTRLSAIARQVEGIRAIDIDLVPYCPKCGAPLAFCEVKSYEVHDNEWAQIRRHADFYGCLAFLFVEETERTGVKRYSSSSGIISTLLYGGENLVLKALEYARDIHECH